MRDGIGGSEKSSTFLNVWCLAIFRSPRRLDVAFTIRYGKHWYVFGPVLWINFGYGVGEMFE